MVSEEKINTIVDKYMDMDGDGNLTEAEVVKFSVNAGFMPPTQKELDTGALAGPD